MNRHLLRTKQRSKAALLDRNPALKSRVDQTLAWLVEDGATVSEALVALLAGLETEGPTILVIDILEQGLDEATQEALIAHLRRRGCRVKCDLLRCLRIDSYDCALLGELADSTLRVKRLADNRGVVCASPVYLKKSGRPQHPDDLAHHECILMRFGLAINQDWPFLIDGKVRRVVVQGHRIANDGGLVRDWCLN